MKRTRIMGLCLVAACAVFAFSATSAFAVENLPHFGKCAAKAGGKYSNGGCTKLAKTVEQEKFEWTPLGAGTVKFTSAKQAGSGPAVLEGVSKKEVSCATEGSKLGEYTSPAGKDQVTNVVGEFTGCELSGDKCKSAGAGEGEIITNKLKGEPGIIKKVLKEEKNEDGSDLVGQVGKRLAEFTCGLVSVTVEGGVVVADKSEGLLKTNKMLNKLLVEFIAEKPGKQLPEKWMPNGNGVSHSSHAETTEFLESELGLGVEKSGQSLKTIQLTSPKTVKLELRQCEKTITCSN